MKKQTTVIFLSLVAFVFYSCDTEVDIESATSEICNCLENHESLDSLSFSNCYDKTFLAETKWIFDHDERKRVNIQIVKALIRTCEAAIAYETSALESNLRPVERYERTRLELKDCREITGRTNLFYLEIPRDTTHVRIQDGIYLETLPNNTYSKLNFRWTQGCNFELEFIESNHYIKKGFSKPGEIYKYQVIDHKPDEKFYVLHGYQGNFIFEINYYYQ